MITVAGLSPSLDLTYLVDTLRLGQIHRPTQVVRCAGGKPLNMARAATALGADALVVALLGGPTGASVAAGLARDGVRVVEVATSAETRTCVSIAAADTQALTEVYEYAAPVPAGLLPRFHAALADALRGRPGWLAICGSPPLDHAPAEVAELVAIGRSGGQRVAVDTHGPALAAALAAGPTLVKVNRLEAASLLGRDLDADLTELARAIRAGSGVDVVLTDGDAGAVALVADPDGAEQVLTVGPPRRRGRFPVGSGDAFLGGLLTALDRGDGWAVALRTAAAAGSANALVPGPGILGPEVNASPGTE
ncbi:MAG: 1-phosphofructokinase family hexose kinase [Propionibacteriaceae bacterium]